MKNVPVIVLLVTSSASPAWALDLETSFGYGLRNPRLGHGGSQIEGWADNALQLDAKLRSERMVAGLEFGRQKTPLAMPGVRPELNPVMAPETTDLRLSLGRTYDWSHWQFTPRLVWMQLSSTPNNQGVPYSGTLLDWAHTRRGFGIGVPAVMSLPRGWELFGEATLLPWMDVRMEKAPYSVGSTGFGEVKLGVGKRLGSDLRAELTVARSLWRGGFEEDTDAYGLRLVYRPEAREK